MQGKFAVRVLVVVMAILLMVGVIVPQAASNFLGETTPSSEKCSANWWMELTHGFNQTVLGKFYQYEISEEMKREFRFDQAARATRDEVRNRRKSKGLLFW